MEISASKASMGELLTDKKVYCVPAFQRSFSWEKKEQITEFFEDIMSVLNGTQNENYFLGNMVFTPDSRGEGRVLILDGQQRFATTILFLAALRENIKTTTFGRKEEWVNLLGTVIYFSDIATCAKNPKLQLNRYDKSFFEKLVIENIVSTVDYKSHDLIKESYLFFKEKISEKISEGGEGFIEKVLTVIYKQLLLIKIEVDSDVNANTIFETLNDRGLELSTADLVKNYIFSLASDSGNSLEEAMDKWKTMVDQVGDEKVTSFLRHYWLSSKGVVTKEDLYKKIKENIKTHNYNDFLTKLTEESNFYGNFSNYGSNFWEDSEIRDILEELSYLNVEQAYVLLLAIFSKYNLESDLVIIKSLVRKVTNFTFRFSTVCGLNPNELERKYSSLANKLRNGTFNDAQIITELRTISPETGLFVEKFKEFEPRAKLARYILTKINNKLMKDAGQEELATNNREVNLEHIIPRKMDIVWKQFFTAKGIKGESLIKNIGNLTLLLAEYNNKLANKIFTAKKTMYQSSVLPINNTLKTFGEFSKTEVESRATNYASEADSIWSV